MNKLTQKVKSDPKQRPAEPFQNPESTQILSSKMHLNRPFRERHIHKVEGLKWQLVKTQHFDQFFSQIGRKEF